MTFASEGIFGALSGSFGALERLLGSGLRCVGSVAQLLQALLMRRDRGINRWRVTGRGRLRCFSSVQGILLRVEQFLIGVAPVVTVIKLALLVVGAVLSTIKGRSVALEHSALAVSAPGFGLPTVELLLLAIQRVLSFVGDGLLSVT